MNGLRLCEVARERYGTTPVIVMITADARRERKVTALTLFVDDFVEKPFDNDVLLARIEAMFRRRDQART